MPAPRETINVIPGSCRPAIRILCGVVLFLCGVMQPASVPLAAAAGGPGTGSANFLNIPVGARETALGGAFTAAADNANSVYYNPAGLGRLQNAEFTFTHNRFVEGVSQQWLAGAYPYKNGALGLGVNYLSVSPFDSYDNNDNRTGSVSAYDMAVYASWGARLPADYKYLKNVTYGVSAKYITEQLATEKGSGYGLDLGVMATSAIENLRFGVSVENVVSSEIKFIEKGAKPLKKYKTGVMYETRSSVAEVAARFSADYVFWSEKPGYIAVGAETLFLDVFAVRLGYSGFGDISNGFNFGLGFDLYRYTGKSLSVDYAYCATYAFGDIQKVGLTYKFGARREAGRAVSKAPVRTILVANPEVKRVRVNTRNSKFRGIEQ